MVKDVSTVIRTSAKLLGRYRVFHKLCYNLLELRKFQKIKLAS